MIKGNHKINPERAAVPYVEPRSFKNSRGPWLVTSASNHVGLAGRENKICCCMCLSTSWHGAPLVLVVEVK